MSVDGALARLDWPEVLDRIAGHATSEPGAEQIRSLRPAASTDQAEARLAIADQMVGLLLKLDWVPARIPDVRSALRRLGIEGSVLGERELIDIGVLLGSSRMARAVMRRFPDELPALADLGGLLAAEIGLEQMIANTFDEGGSIKDSASPALRRTRKELRSARSSLVGKLEAFARRLPDRIQVPDASVTIRSGRYCIPIRREGRSEVGGIVHDESATHQTVFVEPPLAIEPMNRLAGLEREELREIARILERLTQEARPFVTGLVTSQDALAEVDSLFARARWALAHGGVRPRFHDADGSGPQGVRLRLVSAHHPLLLDGSDPSVPFDLELFEGESVLLISGPNAGGKTVLLKTVALTCLLAQAGIIPPTGPGTLLPVFSDLFAVIGDEQSISASLSTFSAQVRGVRETLEKAGTAALALLDEIGSSTDPAEGAALAAAVLTRLADQAGLTVATTHLGALKALSTDDPRIVNASLQFDTVLLRPTFRLVRDRPGRSYAIEIATRLGIPADVIADAQSRIGAEESRMEALLADLEGRETELAELVAEARLREKKIVEREARLSGAEGRAAEKERQLEREGRARAERYLKQARREVADEIRRLREQFRQFADEGTVAADRAEAEASRVRSRVDLLFRQAKRAGEDLVPESGAGAGISVRPGDPVRSTSFGVEGAVKEVRGDRVVLDAGGVRMEVPLDDVEPVARTEQVRKLKTRQEREPESAAGRVPERAARPEVDLRGLRTDEVEHALLPAVDAAHVADLPALRVIHGKGTFAVRDEVNRLLDQDRRIAGLRPGGFEEGGSGVTVVEFRKDGV